jgi:hypothetical protein
MSCKICNTTSDSLNYTQCAGCERRVCEPCETKLTDALTEINGAFYCAECVDKPLIQDLRQFLRTGEHKVTSRDGRETRWFGVRRCTEPDGKIHGWLVAHNGKVWACMEPLAVEAAIREMF